MRLEKEKTVIFGNLGGKKSTYFQYHATFGGSFIASKERILGPHINVRNMYLSKGIYCKIYIVIFQTNMV